MVAGKHPGYDLSPSKRDMAGATCQLRADVHSSASASLASAVFSRKSLQDSDRRSEASSSTRKVAAKPSERICRTTSVPKHHQLRVLQEDKATRSLTPRAGGCAGGSVKPGFSRHSEVWSGDAASSQLGTNSFPKNFAIRALQDEEHAMRTCRSLTPTRTGCSQIRLNGVQDRAIKETLKAREAGTAPRADGISPSATSDKLRWMNFQDKANESRPQSLPLTSIQPGNDLVRSSLPLSDVPTSLSRSSWSDLHRNRSELPRADIKTEYAAAKSGVRKRHQPPNKVVGCDASGYRQAAQLARLSREFSSADESEWISNQFSGLCRVVAVLAVLVVLLFVFSFWAREMP